MSRILQCQFAALASYLLFASLSFLSRPAYAAETAGGPSRIVLRADSPDRKIGPESVTIAAGGREANALSVTTSVEGPLTIALVIDVGPNQATVLCREKEIASGLIANLPETTTFLVIRGGFQPAKSAGTSTFDSVQLLTNEAGPGRRSNIPIYDAVALALKELSARPGVRVAVVIAEGNDSRSRINYKTLRLLAQAQHTSVMTIIVADHATRGSKGIYTYGWDLRDLSSKTAGISIDNDKNTARVVRKLARAIRSLRVVSFAIGGISLGRHDVHVSSDEVGRLHAQKQICVGSTVACSGYEEW